MRRGVRKRRTVVECTEDAFDPVSDIEDNSGVEKLPRFVCRKQEYNGNVDVGPLSPRYR